MKKKLFLAGSLLTIAAALTNCKKETTDSPAPVALNGSYKMTAMEIKNTMGTFDIFADLDDCIKDDLLEFKSNKTYIYKDAGLTCIPKGDDSGTWSIKGADSLVIDGEAAAIIVNNNQQLVLRKAETIIGEVGVVTVTYTKNG